MNPVRERLRRLLGMRDRPWVRRLRHPESFMREGLLKVTGMVSTQPWQRNLVWQRWVGRGQQLELRQ